MIPTLSFRQTPAEQMVRTAASLIFQELQKSGCKLVPLSSLAEDPQYGFTASAAVEPVGPKLVRITDLQDGGSRWGPSLTAGVQNRPDTFSKRAIFSLPGRVPQ